MTELQYREVPLSTVASLSGAELDTIRSWIAKNPYARFRGEKRGRNLYFSLRETYFICILRRLIEYGTQINTAIDVAAKLVDATPTEGPKPDARVLVTHLCGMVATHDEFELRTDQLPIACAFLQAGKIWAHIVRSLQGDNPAPARPRRKRKAIATDARAA